MLCYPTPLALGTEDRLHMKLLCRPQLVLPLLHSCTSQHSVNQFCRTAHLHQVRTQVPVNGNACRFVAARVSAGTSLWPFIGSRYVYSSNIDDVDPVQLSDLWAKTLKVRRDPIKILKSLKHSYLFVVVLAEDHEMQGTRKIVGVGRAISDGAFIASICDVAVDPLHQRKGIGRKIVKYLAKAMKNMDGPTGFAAFPPPLARRFFWRLGFRYDKKFKYMLYQGSYLNNDPNSSEQRKKG